MAPAICDPLASAPALCAESRAAIVDLQSALDLDDLCKAVQRVLQHELPDCLLCLQLENAGAVESTSRICFALGDDQAPGAMLSIGRPAGGPALSMLECSLLEYLHPMIEAGLRRIRATQAEEQLLRSYEFLLARMPTATLVFSARGELQFATPEGRKLNQRWIRGMRRPESVTQLKQQLIKATADAGPDGSSIKLAHPTIKGLAARIERRWHAPSLRQQASYVVEFNETATDAATGNDAPPFSPEAWLALQKLSIAERKVALLVAHGLSNEEIAQHRCRSPRTIEYQLLQIFRKLGINRRTQLVRLLS